MQRKQCLQKSSSIKYNNIILYQIHLPSNICTVYKYNMLYLIGYEHTSKVGEYIVHIHCINKLEQKATKLFLFRSYETRQACVPSVGFQINILWARRWVASVALHPEVIGGGPRPRGEAARRGSERGRLHHISSGWWWPRTGEHACTTSGHVNGKTKPTSFI